MRSRNIVLAAALALLASVSVPTAAQAATCNGVQLRWTSGDLSLCYGLGFHDIEHQTSTSIRVAQHYQATLHFRGTRPDGSPITMPKTYHQGKHLTNMDGNSLSQLFVKKA